MLNHSEHRYLQNDFLWRLLKGAAPPGPMRDWREAAWRKVNALIAAIGRPIRVIDFACGDGRHVLELGSLCQSAVGIDLDPVPLSIARENAVGRLGLNFYCRNMECPEQVINSADPLEVEAADLTVPSFDVAICLWSSVFCADPRKVFNAMKRQVVPGGLVLLTAYSAKSASWRCTFYEEIGKGKAVATANAIHMASGAVSVACTPEYARELFGADVNIETFADGDGLMITQIID